MEIRYFISFRCILGNTYDFVNTEYITDKPLNNLERIRKAENKIKAVGNYNSVTIMNFQIFPTKG